MKPYTKNHTDQHGVDLLIIVPPAGKTHAIFPPYGAMYIASALKCAGYAASILNVDTERISNAQVLARIKSIAPKYIGFSGIVAPSYKYIKDLSNQAKALLPNTIQILGGGLSSAPQPIFKNTAIDIIVLGEGDVTIVELLKCLDTTGNLASVAGIYHRGAGSFLFTGRRDLIKNLDTLAYPAFDLVDMDTYIIDGVDFIHRFTRTIKDPRIYDRARSRRMITITTNRGCFGECSFCFRAYRGLRLQSFNYIFDFIQYCIDTFQVGFFSFGDECFSPNKARNWEFIEEFKKRKPGIIFRILGMRVDTVDKDILRAYKDIGCWMIEYGFESGSQKMLNIMDKRVSVAQNRDVARWTKEAGIFTSPTLVLGMPGETDATISESINFMKSLDYEYKQYQWTHALPIPGSPLYEFAQLSGAIDDEDAYLSSLDGDIAGAGVFHVNLTDEPDSLVQTWAQRIQREIDNDYLLKKYKIPLLAKCNCVWKLIIINYRRKTLWQVIAKKLHRLLRFKSPKIRPSETSQKVRFRKKEGFYVEPFLKEYDCSVVNREVSLKKINEKIRELACRKV